MALAGVASANTINIALLSATGNTFQDNDVIAKIQANAPFLNISVINIAQVTPDVTTLEGYQALMVMSNIPFANGITLGDNLKQYIDDGHGLVIANNANTTSPCANNLLICGSFQSADYWALEPGPPIYSLPATLGTIYVPDSPLLAGVSSFNGGSVSNRINNLLNSNATRIADWSDGTPLIATRTFGSGAREVALNFYPPSSDAWSGLWLSSTDGGKMMANALIYAGNINVSESEVPEPNYLVAGAGLALVSLLLRRRR